MQERAAGVFELLTLVRKKYNVVNVPLTSQQPGIVRELRDLC